jgi:predicted negative regulator of RcsB-dependent stress response
MIEYLKGVWAKWKVHISLVGGVLILSTVWGTCSFEPAQVEEAEESSEVSEEAVEEVTNSSEAPAEIGTTSVNAENTEDMTTSTPETTGENVGNDN